MMYVTKLLKKTTGEDNKRTEMYVSLSFSICLPWTMLTLQVHDCQPDRPHGADSFGCDFCTSPYPACLNPSNSSVLALDHSPTRLVLHRL